MFRVYSEYVQGMLSMLKVYLMSVQDMFNVCLEYVQSRAEKSKSLIR